MPKASDMPLRGLPLSIQEDALTTVAVALYAEDMAGACAQGRMAAGHADPTIVATRQCEVGGVYYTMTVTVELKVTKGKR